MQAVGAHLGLGGLGATLDACGLVVGTALRARGIALHVIEQIHLGFAADFRVGVIQIDGIGGHDAVGNVRFLTGVHVAYDRYTPHMQLLIGTSNKGKLIELGESLAGLDVRIVSPADLGITESPHETGETFTQNAGQKARFYRERSGLPSLADDSGILVEALLDELGIHTRRWGAGPDASDHAWISFFLERMRTEENRRARFVCALCYIDDSGAEHVFEGVCDGVITDELQADYLPGLPISACFQPDGFDRVYSALSVEEKNAISHRGRAMQKFREYLISVQP